MSVSFLDLSTKALAQAIQLDEQKRNKEAIKSYILACEYALRAVKTERDELTRVKVLIRLQGWLERAEALKALEKTSQLPDVPSPERRSAIRGDALDGVVGLENVKQALREAIILPSLQPQVFVGERKPWKGILLYGPPGTGKSLLASTIAKEADCTFFAVSSSDIISKYLGESEKAIREVFEKARQSVKNHPSRRAVVFIDEVDAIGKSRGLDGGKESDTRVLTELLKQMDGVGPDNSRVVVIGATNLPQILDAALRRRFERRLLVPLPGVASRAQIIAKYIGPPGKEHDIPAMEVAKLAQSLKGYSGADLSSFANELLLRPVRSCLNATYFRRTTTGKLVPCAASSPSARSMRMLDKDFDAKALEVPLATVADAAEVAAKSKPSVNVHDLSAIEQFDREFGERLETENEESAPIEAITSVVERQWRKSGWSAAGLREAVSSVWDSISSSVGSWIRRNPVPA